MPYTTVLYLDLKKSLDAVIEMSAEIAKKHTVVQ